MPRPIVIAHHLIWTVYGTWLPNDPRGSGSRAIACDVLRDLGDVHYGRKRVQPSDAVIRAATSASSLLPACRAVVPAQNAAATARRCCLMSNWQDMQRYQSVADG